MKDIGKKVGVSQTAVSKVLNNLPIRISEEKRQKIKEIAERFNYRPNIIARSLRDKKTKTIGIVVPGMSTLFYPELIKSIEIKLFSYGYCSIVCDSEDDPSCERSHLEDLVSRWVDGLVIAPATGRENIEFLRSLGETNRPLILIDRYFPEENFSFVISENKRGAREGVKVLLQQGVSRIIYIGEKDRNPSLDDRLQGVKEEAKERNISFTDEDIFLSYPERSQVKKICNFIFEGLSRKELRDTGIFLESNRFLMGLLDSARDKGFFIPDDFKVIGFDPFGPEIIYPEDLISLRVLKSPIPIIKQDIKGMGEKVSQYLFTCLKENTRFHWQVKLPVEIIVPE